MKKLIIIVLFISGGILMISGCVSTEQVLYFQPIQRDTIVKSYTDYEPFIQADDLLAINVSASDYESVAPFNLPIVSQNLLDGRATGVPVQQNYLVMKDGSIDFPVLGNIIVAGYTRQEVKKILVKELQKYIKEPIVNIQIMNFKVTVLGEVARPGTYQIKNERITLLEALGTAGDLNITGRRDNILVIRELKGEKAFTRVDITSDELFDNPVYYLKQNDVVYVEPNKNRVNSSNYTPWIGVIISSVSLLATVLNLILK